MSSHFHSALYNPFPQKTKKTSFENVKHPTTNLKSLVSSQYIQNKIQTHHVSFQCLSLLDHYTPLIFQLFDHCLNALSNILCIDHHLLFKSGLCYFFREPFLISLFEVTSFVFLFSIPNVFPSYHSLIIQLLQLCFYVLSFCRPNLLECRMIRVVSKSVLFSLVSLVPNTMLGTLKVLNKYVLI